MSGGLFVSASGLLAEDARVDVISNNLANVRTAGYRKDFVTFRQRLLSARDRATAGNRAAPGLVLDRTNWDPESGPVAMTGRPLDLAIRGNGFFAVNRDGRALYTRAGDFAVDARGRLVTADGLGEVLSTSGEPVNLSGLERFEVNGRGEVLSAQGIVARLGVTDFDRPEMLRKTGDALFADGGQAAPRAGDGEIVQGALESSSVEPVRELTSLVSAFRAYEMNAQMLKIQDEMLGRAANDVGRLPG
ncbi:MAG: flagellar hook-basal body protein [Planctomycetes bacterium]|nr:flagellar hook-basal body protein [Planctomycetota bacterium]